MKRKMTLVCVAVGLVVLGLWLLTSGLARAASQPLDPRLTGNPLDMPGAVSTPTLRLELPSPPVFEMDVSGEEPPSFLLEVRNPLTVEVDIAAELMAPRLTTGELISATLRPVSRTVAGSEVGTFTLSIEQEELPMGRYTGTLKFSAADQGLTTEQPFVLLVSPSSGSGATVTPMLRLVGLNGETMLSPPVYRMHVSDKKTSLYVLNPLNEEVSIAAELETLHAADGKPVPASLGLSPGSQTVEAGDIGMFALTLVEGWLPAGRYTGTLKLSAAGIDPAPGQPFELLVSSWAAGLEWAQKEFTYVADEEYTQATVWVTARYTDAKDIHAQLATLAAKDKLTATFSTADFLSVTAQPTLTQDSIAPLTLSFTANRLPAPAQYKGVLRLSASNAAPITAPFTLVIPDRAPVSPWAAELAWAQEEFVYVADEEHTQATVWVTARYTDAKDIHAQLPTLAFKDKLTATFSTADFLSVTAPPTLTQDSVATLTLTFTPTQLPAPAQYKGVLRLSASNAAPITAPFTLVIPDRAPVSPWAAELAWAQKEFVYVADEEHTEATVWVTARYADTRDVQLELATLMAENAVTESFRTAYFLSIPPPSTLMQDSVATLTLTFTPTQLPAPGTYTGTLRLSASNAQAIEKPFTLVIPEEHAHGGPYRLVYAELAKTDKFTTPLTLTTALQFPGVRWLPGSTSVAGDSWPILVGALLAGVGLAMLLGYTLFALKPTPKGSDPEQKRPWAWAKRNGFAVGTFVVTSALSGALFCCCRPIQAHVEKRTLHVWEAKGRGPVRDVRVLPGEVVNEIGDTGQICIDSKDGEITVGDVLTEEIKVGDVLTVAVTGIQGLSHPGVYTGRVLIQSPDIAGGVVEVPVQVTVHDFIFWPALVILLGVVAGGWAKYLQGIASQRLEKHRDIEESWQSWDDYMLRDPYLYPSNGNKEQINPIYGNVRRELDYAIELLGMDVEWGGKYADHVVSEVKKKLTTYQRLADAADDLRDELGSTEAKKIEKMLCQGDLDSATDRIGKMRKAVLPFRIGVLRQWVEQKKENKKVKPKAKTIIDLLNEAEKLLKEEDYGEAWRRFKDAEFEVQALGLKVSCLSILSAAFAEEAQIIVPLLRSVLKTPELAQSLYTSKWLTKDILARFDMTPKAEPEKGYAIKPSFAQVRYRVRDTNPFRLVYRGGSWPSSKPAGTNVKSIKWSASRVDKASEKEATFHPETEEFDPKKGADTRVEFPEQGRWKVEASFLGENEKCITEDIFPYSLDIKSSGMEVIYQAMRRHSFNRRLAAGLLALVGGMAAKRVFGLTFGSFEQYLGAFAWGVSAGYGVDQIADGYNGLRQAMKDLVEKLGTKSEKKSPGQQTSTTQTGQPGQADPAKK